MSTGKLDQSLDDILQTRRQSNRRGRGNRRSGAGRPAAADAPVGGVHKSTKQTKQAKVAPTAPAAAISSGESKIMISNLPLDIEEGQLKEYFSSAVNVGKPKRVLMQYGPSGRSLGSATVIFGRADAAAKAVQALDNIRIDNRLIKVELIMSAKNVPAPAAQSSLANRVSQPKKAGDKPKPATAPKDTPASGRGRGRSERGRGRGRGGRNPREKKKTVEELDAEMEDYFPAGEGGNDAMATNNGESAPPAAGGDTAMDDEML